MAKLGANVSPRYLRHQYRLVVTNDDTFEEVVTFRLSRVSVYIMLSSIFVILVTLTVSLIVFTPLKGYLPGYGRQNTRGELQALKFKTDSLEQSIRVKDEYLLSLKKVLAGEIKNRSDSTTLKGKTR